MRRRNLVPPFLSLTLVAALAPCFAQTRPPRRGVPARGAQTVLFAVSGGAESAPGSIDPIVVIEGGRYTPPPMDDAFVGDYFRTGREYTVLSGGGRAGSAKVLKSNADADGCVITTADAEVRTSPPLGTEARALAVSSDGIGAVEGSRRAPTEAERAAALALARTLYGAKRVRAALVRRMKTEDLTATDLDRDGRFELIGNFQIDAGRALMHNLFVIFEPAARGKYRPAFTWYHKGAEEAYEDLGLVDVVDLDRDGTAEVVAVGHYYESYAFAIYQRRRGQWRKIYSGGGGGC